MPAFELTSPDGKKYRVEGPEGSTAEQAYGILRQQLAGQSGATRGGDLARGLAHGVASGLGMSGMVGDAPADASGWRTTGENIGQAIPPIAAGFIPGGAAVKTAIGTTMGALQPAGSLTERAENAAIGAGSAWGAGKIAKMGPRVKTALDRLSEMGIGSYFGASHLGPWGGLGGLYAGREIGRHLESIFGGGLGDLVAFAARNPGLAAYLGIKASPYAEQAGQFVGQQLGKPSE